MALLVCALGVSLAQAQEPARANPPNPTVLFDSYHAHNFLDRGVIPGEHSYHHLTGLKRAAQLLRDRQVPVGELIIGPITPQRLSGVKLVILNLPSADRPPWLVSEIEAVVDFVRQGGGIIFITDHSNCYYHQYHLLPLWERLGLIPTFETVCEREPNCLLTPSGEGWLLVRHFEPHPVTESVKYLAIQTGGRVVGQSIVARTSPQAWADAGATPMYAEGPIGLFGDMKYSASEEQGAQGIVLAKQVGQGRVVVISDQNAMGDLLISYADNWRLWLNACSWAGGMKLDHVLTSRLPSTANASTVALDQQSIFDQITSQQPDRNAQPQLPPGTWQVQCWEPLTRGQFHWGGTDAIQYYYFWCWLNRWTWTSAHEEASHPQPLGRQLLLAADNDIQDPSLIQRQREILSSGGKVILLSSVDQSSPSTEPTEAQIAWRDRCLQQLVIDAESPLLWRNQPLNHWQLTSGQGTLVLIPDAIRLRNAAFERPERTATAPHAKWLGLLYQWLFEQP